MTPERYPVFIFSNGEPLDLTDTNTKPESKPMPSPYDMMIADVVRQVEDKIPTTDSVVERIKPLVPKIDVGDIMKQIEERLAKVGTMRIEVDNKQTGVVTTLEESAHKSLPKVVGIMQSKRWPALVGPTGSGKTMCYPQIVKIFDFKLVSIKQMTRLLAPHELIGFMNANGQYVSGAWTDVILGRHYTINGVPDGTCENTPALLVVDEMDNGNENIQMLLKALKTGHIMMPYGLQKVNSGLCVMATMNTWGQGATREYVGRCAQDAALLNEFFFVEWGYDVEFERKLLHATFAAYDPAKVGDYELRHMDTLHTMFQAMREKATKNSVKVIISTRNIVDVANILLTNPTWTVHEVLKGSIYKSLSDVEIGRIECPECWRGVEKHTTDSATTPTPTPATPTVSANERLRKMVMKIDNLLAADSAWNKITCIKLFRDVVTCGLAEAKMIVESWDNFRGVLLAGGMPDGCVLNESPF